MFILIFCTQKPIQGIGLLYKQEGAIFNVKKNAYRIYIKIPLEKTTLNRPLPKENFQRISEVL